MRPYEVMVIFDTGIEPQAIQAVVERILATVSDRGGTPGAVDRWGRRPFAYEVRHRREGYYVVIEFSGDSAIVAELDRMLGLADEVLRHKVIRIPEKVALGEAVRSGQVRGENGRPSGRDAGRGRGEQRRSEREGTPAGVRRPSGGGTTNGD